MIPSKRKSSFDEYQREREERRIRATRQALKVIINSSYKNVTRLAKDVAKIIYEIELKEWELKANDPNFTRRKPKSVSYTTLIRNSAYRTLLELHLGDQDIDSIEPVVSDFEILGIRCVNLESENEVLRDRLRHADAPLIKLEPIKSNDDELERLKQEKILLVDIIKGIMSEANEIFHITDEGLISYSDKVVVKAHDLQKLQKMTNQLGGLM